MKTSKRRQFLAMLGLGSVGLGMTALPAKKAQAHHAETHFDDASLHRLVYQCNKADHDYLDHVLFSCGDMLRKYGDDIELVITALGPGLNLLAHHPRRAISPEHQQRVRSLAQYGVRFQACGNTMKAMNWTEKDLLEVAQVVPIGVDGIMRLQEQGFSYISW
jgi:intracellular sulfur oxidation DsrE/DsrF family protein